MCLTGSEKQKKKKDREKVEGIRKKKVTLSSKVFSMVGLIKNLGEN